MLGFGQIFACNFVFILIDEMQNNIDIPTHVHASRVPSPPISNGAHTALRGFLANGIPVEAEGGTPNACMWVGMGIFFHISSSIIIKRN